MSNRKLEDWLDAYIQYTSQAESPEHLHYWVGVSTVASALQRKVWFDQQIFKWYPNFYILLVGPPGIVTKSTTISIGKKLLEGAEVARFSPSSLSWQWLHTDLADRAEIFVDHTGTSRVQTHLTCAISELSKFVRWDDPDMLSWIVDGYDCPEIDTRATFAHGENPIRNLWLNLIGAITPKDLQESMGVIAREGGFLSRCVVLYADQKRHRTPYVDALPQQPQLKADLVHDLQEINKLTGPYVLTSGARTLGETWYESICDKMEARISVGKSTSQLARWQTMTHKLAMVMTAAKTDQLVITKDVLEAAIWRIEQTPRYLREALGQTDAVIEHQHSKRIETLLKRHGIQDKRTLWAHLSPHMNYKDFEAALEAAFQAKRIIRGKMGTGWMYGPRD